MIKRIKLKDTKFAKMIDDISQILYENEIIVDKDKLESHILETIKESSPHDKIEIVPSKKENIYKIIRFKSQTEYEGLFK